MAGREYHHPYTPYDIQTQFMHAVYDCLENGKVGIFESPTGTGKSLSLICASLTWLRDHKKRTLEEGHPLEATDSDEPGWMVEHARKQKKQAALRRRRALESRIADIKAKELRAKNRYQHGARSHKRQEVTSDVDGATPNEAQFILADYESDEDNSQKTAEKTYDDSGLSAETQALMKQFGYSVEKENGQEEDAPDEIKIFICSRTHSQLTQFSSELNRVKMPPAINDTSLDENDEKNIVEEVKHITLGSRKNLCINPKVNKLGKATTINERCLELQQPNISSDSKCPFIPTKESEALVNDFRDHALAKIRDIEDLMMTGKQLGICPYYASRPATRYCEIVTLPYPLLLQKSAREALDLSLKDHIVIIDEAHNLMDAIAGIYSVSVSLAQVQQARMQLTVYLQRFRNKLKGKNRVYVAQTVRVLDAIIAWLQSRGSESGFNDGLVDPASLMSGKGVDQINLFKLNTYLRDSRLARKVDGYTNHVIQSREEGSQQDAKKPLKGEIGQSLPVLTHVQQFLMSFMNPSAEGRFFVSKEESSGVVLKYLLLDPTFHFKDIVEEARAVVLAGGTMSPMSDYEHYLLSYLDPSRIMTLSCGHVIPPSNLLAIPVVQTSSGSGFEFTFEKRNSERMMIDLGNAILRITQHIPDGLVVFFPSYSYLDLCAAAWKRLRPTGSDVPLWDSVLKIKPIFCEQRAEQKPLDPTLAAKETVAASVLKAYSSAVASGNGRGALLLAVMGGTLSEGINFSDALGRGVVVVGMPFPNPHSAEWKAKVQNIFRQKQPRKDWMRKLLRGISTKNACMRT